MLVGSQLMRPRQKSVRLQVCRHRSAAQFTWNSSFAMTNAELSSYMSAFCGPVPFPRRSKLQLLQTGLVRSSPHPTTGNLYRTVGPSSLLNNGLMLYGDQLVTPRTVSAVKMTLLRSLTNDPSTVRRRVTSRCGWQTAAGFSSRSLAHSDSL